jgi:hypothetical protein
MNIGAPVPAIPVQATPASRATLVPQPNVPTISPITGSVGTIGQPATGTSTISSIPTAIPAPPFSSSSGSAQLNAQTTSRTELLYVIPPSETGEEQCIQGERRHAAFASTVVAPGTPGAVPVAIQNVTVYKPVVERQLRFAPLRKRTETLVRVVNPRTGRVVRTYCQMDERQVTSFPVLHTEEVIRYEPTTVKIGTPIKQNYPQNYTPNYQPHIQTKPTQHNVNYPPYQQDQFQPTENKTFTTELY